MTVPQRECDYCGGGSESDGIRLCASCEMLEHEVGGDLTVVSSVIEKRRMANRLREEAAALDEMARLEREQHEERHRQWMSVNWTSRQRSQWNQKRIWLTQRARRQEFVATGGRQQNTPAGPDGGA